MTNDIPSPVLPGTTPFSGQINIVTPCHNMPVLILTVPEGRPYMTSDVPDEIICTAEGCYNSWSANGVADSFNK